MNRQRHRRFGEKVSALCAPQPFGITCSIAKENTTGKDLAMPQLSDFYGLIIWIGTRTRANTKSLTYTRSMRGNGRLESIGVGFARRAGRGKIEKAGGSVA